MRALKKAVAAVCAVAMLATMVVVTPQNADAAKAPKLTKSKVTVKIGKTATIKVKNGQKKAKVTWKLSKKNIVKIAGKSAKGNKAYAKIKGLKKGKVTLTAVYKLGKKTKKLNCKVTVPAKAGDTTVTQAPAAPTKTPDNNQATPVPTPVPDPFTVIDGGKANVMLYVDANDPEYDGYEIIAEAVKADFARVLGIGTDIMGVANESDNGLQVVTDASALKGKAIIAGTIGGNEIINKLVEEKKIDLSDVEGRWECYKIQVVKNPVEGVDEAIVIVGSDKRGTIYGMFRISELMGISPWVWWADAVPTVKDKVDLPGNEVNVTSKEPSVKYRGIFLNDESPSLTTWTDRKFGGRNHKFYQHVFELILRLRGDYLWPAMWGNEFSKDGTDGGASTDTLANAKLADKYGIVMGASHHEPCYRAGNEWGQEYNQYKGSLTDSSANAWNKYNIPGESGYNEKINTAIEAFWRDGIKRNGQFENITGVGMRGEADSSLPAADNPPKYAELLNYIITTQKTIKEEEGDTNPSQLVIYKEVEDAWNAGALYEQDCMKDTYAMFADDNWAYIRTLPTYEQQSMVGGLGMYYHFDYVGAPKSYTWIQTTQLSRIWDQMSVTYDYGIDDVWIVNVGDLKPMEYDISYFMDLAYDYEKWGVDGQDKLEEYKAQWIKQQFGAGLDDDQCAEAVQLIDDYLDLETSRKVEHILYNTAGNCSDMFSVDNYNEAYDILMKCNNIMDRASSLYDDCPEELKAAFYQLVYYPAMAAPNVVKIQIYAALNQKYANLGLSAANLFRSLAQDAVALDTELYNGNNKLPVVGDKWSGVQSAGQNYHIGMTSWETNSGKLPSYKSVNVSGEGKMAVLVDSIKGAMTKAYASGDAELPTFTSTAKEAYVIELCNKGGSSYDFTATPSADWIKVSKAEGTVNEIQSVIVTVDWDKVKEDASGSVEISDGSNTVTVAVNAEVVDTTGMDENTYVMANDYATIDVSKYTKIAEGTGVNNAGETVDNKMVVVPDNGTYLSAIRTSQSRVTYEDTDSAPYVEYKVYVPKDGTYTIQCQFNPTSNVEYNNQKLRFGISVDGGDVKVTNSIVNNYLAGTWKQGTWSTDIEKNHRSSNVSNISLKAGVHTIRYYQCDPNMALIRMTVFSGSLASVYNSPAESYYVGKDVNTDYRIYNIETMYNKINE